MIELPAVSGNNPPMEKKAKKRVGRPPDGIKRQPVNMTLPSALVARLREYTSESGESASNLVARLVAEFFRTDGKPPGNVRSTLKSKLNELEK